MFLFKISIFFALLVKKFHGCITNVASRRHASSIDCFFCRKDRFSLTVSCCNAPRLGDFTKLLDAQCTPSVVRASAVDVLAAGLDTRGMNVCLGRVASSSLGPDRDTTCGCAVDLHRATCSAILLQNSLELKVIYEFFITNIRLLWNCFCARNHHQSVSVQAASAFSRFPAAIRYNKLPHQTQTRHR